MRVFTPDDFDFELPEDLIAQHPASERSASRLLDATGAGPADRTFRDLPALLRAGDLLVFNDTRVVKARLFGAKPTGGRVELLVERVLGGGEVAAQMKTGKKPAAGTVLAMDGGFSATLLDRWPDAQGPMFRLLLSADPFELMETHGHVPLPPYIAHADDAQDESRYQTVFASQPGAVAAPTAALHFDDALLAQLDSRGVERCMLTLHVGAGTFQPVKTATIAEHRMHAERYRIGSGAIAQLQRARADGRRIVAVGTTTVRTLESWARSGQAEGETSIFIQPGHRFTWPDLLITNFHLPRSTLMMLVSAFAGHERIMTLYRHAVRQRYRFFSYGDAMLLARDDTAASSAAGSAPEAA